MPNTRQTLMTILALLVVAGAAAPAAAVSEPSSDLLLPWFEVHLASQRTTLFAVGNAADEPVDVKASVHTNWGIPVVERTIRLQAGEVKPVNLRDWLGAGNVPDPKLRGIGLEHVQAALTGQLSPKDDMFYATQADPFDPELAVGYVTFRVTSSPRLDALWGDYFWVDPEQDYAEGELLVDIDYTSSCGALCRTHRMRFMDGGAFDGGTKLVVWSPRRVQPSPNANAAFARLLALSPLHREPGEEFDERVLELLPVQLVDVGELFLDEDFGWMDVATDEEVYIGVRYSANNRFSVALQTWCIPPPPPEKPKRASIDIEKSTNGEDADEPSGPEVPSGGDVTWEYVVTNTGTVPLTQIRVTDDQEGEIDCPETGLGPGDSMTCSLSGKAPPAGESDFQYANLATVTGIPPTGADVTDDDPSHYWVKRQPSVEPEPAIDIEKATNGHDADAGKGPKLSVGQTVTWTYVVTNTSIEDVTITGISVTDDREGAVSCPKSSLAKGESMTCTKTGVAVAGEYANLATVNGAGPSPGNVPVSDSDPSHYHADPPPPPPASIDIEKATNGHDADSAPGPTLPVGDPVTWAYVVTNTGQAVLTGVAVTDDREGAIACPKSTLQPGESMTCTETGTAQLGQYANLGTVTGASQADGSAVSDSDPSHYFAEDEPEPCAICEGKVTRLTLRYLGGIAGAHVQVIAKRGPGTDTVFDGIVSPGGTFEVVGPASGSGGFSGTLGTEIRFKVNGLDNTTMHTSCSQPIGPGLVSGDFLVLEGASSGGGLLCPVN